MPIDENGVKWACEPCVRGHRASRCDHFSRWMVRVKKAGRPLRECPHAVGGCSCGEDKVIMVRVEGVKLKDGKYDCNCTKLRSFDPAFDNPNSQPSARPVRMQDPQDPTRTIPYNNMSRSLQQQVLNDANRQLPENQPHATPNGAPTETANDQHVPARPHHSLPSSDTILSQRPSTPLNISANGDFLQAGAAIYTSPTRNSQSPHQQQPHSLVQAQSPTVGQGYSQFPGADPNSRLYSNLGSLPQQLNRGNRVPQIGTILYQQVIRDGHQEDLSPGGPRFTNPDTGAVYHSDPPYPGTLAETDFLEGEGYLNPEHTIQLPDDIDRLGVSDFEWPSISDALSQSGFGATTTNGTNGATPMNGTNGATPMNGTNGEAPINGTNGATPTNGASGATPTNDASVATPINGTNGLLPRNSANGANPINGTNGATPIYGANEATPMNVANGATPTNGANGATPMNGANGATPMNGANGATPMNVANGATPMNGANGATPMNGIHGQFSVNGTRSSAALNALSSSSDCECGPGCNCVYCAAHPYNPATRARVQELGQIIESDFLRHPHPDTLQHFFTNGDPSDQIPHTMRNSDYYTLRYPMEHPDNQICTGVSAICPCGSDCTCVGCLTHAGQH